MHLEISLILSQILAFLIMLWILKKFAWKPLLKIMHERKQKIEAEFDKIELEKKEVSRLSDLYQEKLKRIEEEARQKIAEALFIEQEMARKIQDEAHEKAKAILLKSQEDIKNEIYKAKDELKQQLISTIVQTTQNLLREKLDREKDQTLIRDLLNEVKIDERL